MRVKKKLKIKPDIFCIHALYQKKEFAAFCIPCGKFIMGVIVICDVSMTPCRQKICKYEEKHTEALAKVNGEFVCVRKLKNII